MKKLLVLLAVATVVAFWPSAWANAADASGSLNVSATVMAECVVSGGGNTLAFGDFYPIRDEGSKAAVGSVTIQCTSGSAVHVGLDQGLNYSGGSRRLKHGENDYMTYQLYLDSSHEQPWGDTSSDNRMAVQNTNWEIGNQLTVYGRLSGSGSLPVGEYTDTVTVNVWIDAI
jgi:spore coat protein U-like protein